MFFIQLLREDVTRKKKDDSKKQQFSKKIREKSSQL